MATLAYKTLADGQLANTKGTLYTVPAATTTAIKSITLCNTGGGSNTVKVYIKRSGGTSRRICYVVQATNEQSVISDFTLATGDIIEGEATNATQVDYMITGAENA